VLAVEERPSCKEIVERINAIIQGVCPDIATYDADADATFKAKLEREAELRLRHDKQLRQKRQQKYSLLCVVRQVNTTFANIHRHTRLLAECELRSGSTSTFGPWALRSRRRVC
jgi:hypothetical protein